MFPISEGRALLPLEPNPKLDSRPLPKAKVVSITEKGEIKFPDNGLISSTNPPISKLKRKTTTAIDKPIIKSPAIKIPILNN